MTQVGQPVNGTLLLSMSHARFLLVGQIVEVAQTLQKFSEEQIANGLIMAPFQR